MFSVWNIAIKEVKAQTLSSCPYAITMLLSRPQSRALPAGTISNSADIRSSFSISYVSFNSFSICATTASFSSPQSGALPTKISRASPSMTDAAVFSICLDPRCGRRSVIANIGSSSFSPITTLNFVPSFFTTTP